MKNRICWFGRKCRLIKTASVWSVLVFIIVCARDVRAAFTAGNLAVFLADSSTTNNTTFTILELDPSVASQSSPVNSIPINGTSGPDALRTSGSATSTGYLADSNDGTLLAFAAHNSTIATVNANTLTARGVGTLNSDGTFSMATTYTGTSGNQTRSASSVNNATWFIGDQGGFYSNGSSSASPSANIRSTPLQLRPALRRSEPFRHLRAAATPVCRDWQLELRAGKTSTWFLQRGTTPTIFCMFLMPPLQRPERSSNTHWFPGPGPLMAATRLPLAGLDFAQPKTAGARCFT